MPDHQGGSCNTQQGKPPHTRKRAGRGVKRTGRGVKRPFTDLEGGSCELLLLLPPPPPPSPRQPLLPQVPQVH